MTGGGNDLVCVVAVCTGGYLEMGFLGLTSSEAWIHCEGDRERIQNEAASMGIGTILYISIPSLN